MVAGLEGEPGGLAPAALFHVGGVVRADGHGGMGNVGDGHQLVGEAFLHLAHAGVDAVDLIAQGAHLRHDVGGVLALFPHDADLLGHGVAAGFHFLDLAEQGAALLIQSQKAVQRYFAASFFQGLDDLLRIGTDEFEIKHNYASYLINTDLL